MDVSKLITHSTKKPKSVLRIVISVSVVMLVLWLFLVSRMEFTQTSGVMATNQVSSDSTATEQTVSLKETLLNEKKTAQTAQKEVEEEVPVFQNALTTFALMMVVLGGIWFWTKRKSTSPTKESDIKELSAHVLGQGSQLKIVEINQEIWVLGLTAGSLTLLHRYPKEQWNNEESVPIKPVEQDFKSMVKLFGN